MGIIRGILDFFDIFGFYIFSKLFLNNVRMMVVLGLVII